MKVKIHTTHGAFCLGFVCNTCLDNQDYFVGVVVGFLVIEFHWNTKI